MKPADISLLHTLGKPTISPDGRFAVVAVTRPDLDADEYRGGLWIVPTDGSAEPRRLTSGHADSSPVYSPDGAHLAFVRGGDGAKPQLYVLPTAGGEPWQVTDRPLGVSDPAWSPDSRRIAFAARVPEEGRYGDTKPNQERPRHITTLKYRFDGLGFYTDRHSHIFVADPFASQSKPAEPVQVSAGDFEHFKPAWSPDGQQLAFTSARHEERDTTHVSDIWLCAPDGTGLRSVTATDLALGDPQFTPDGKAIVFAAAQPGANRVGLIARHFGLWSVPADGSAPARRLTDAERYQSAADFAVTEDGALFVTENRGAADLLLVPYSGGEATVLISGHRAVTGVAAAGDTVVAAVADQESCGELVVLRDGKELTLTSFGSGLEVLPLEEITTTAPDGYPVHGWIARPAGEGPHPVLLMIHGGPFAQYGWQVFDEAQVYASAGYAVVYGNPRGSSGYGQAHGSAIIGDVGAKSAVDLLALLDAALATGGLDTSRVGVLGGSHGGFMTTWLAAHHGSRFKAAISERAVNAIDSFHGSSDIGWSFPFDLYGSDPAGWAALSPLTYADRIDIPFFIIHSEHDWRCPVEQAQRLFVALKLRGAEAEMLLFPGEGHELSRSGLPSHRVARFDAILEWWDRHL
ncbi:S9 family peptidase [Nonomuraea sp. NPDC050556]|uniref:S9 family peptidase n=1 Tax=Nonomuraea sp. NPDC050556 TaxID=3364369 RepID=UPI0037AFF0D8